MAKKSYVVAEKNNSMSTVDFACIAIGSVAAAACAYRAYKGDTDGMIDDLWAGAKTGAMYGAIGGAVIGVGAGAYIGSKYNAAGAGAMIGGTTLALSGAIYGGALGGLVCGAGVYSSGSINNDDLA